VTAHEGTLRVESSPEAGTTVIVDLPLTAAAGPPTPVATTSPTPTSTTPTGTASTAVDELASTQT